MAKQASYGNLPAARTAVVNTGKRRIAMPLHSPGRDRKFGQWEAYEGESDSHSSPMVRGGRPGQRSPSPQRTVWVGGSPGGVYHLPPHPPPASMTAESPLPPPDSTAHHKIQPLQPVGGPPTPSVTPMTEQHQSYLPSVVHVQPQSSAPMPQLQMQHALPTPASVVTMSGGGGGGVGAATGMEGKPLSYIDVISKVKPESPSLLRLKLKGNISRLPVKAVKETLQQVTGVPPERQVLEKDGFYLSDHLHANDINLIHGSVLVLSLSAPSHITEYGAGRGGERVFFYTPPVPQTGVSPQRH